MVKNYLSAVKLLFQEWQVPSVVKDLSSPAWTLTLRAIAYSAGPQPDHRSAVTKEDLIKLVAVCDTDHSLVPLRVALIFGFLGYLRISNLAPPTAQSFDPARHSSWADVRPSKQGILFDLKWTKTLQTQRGVTTITISRQEFLLITSRNMARGLLKRSIDTSCSNRLFKLQWLRHSDWPSPVLNSRSFFPGKTTLFITMAPCAMLKLPCFIFSGPSTAH